MHEGKEGAMLSRPGERVPSAGFRWPRKHEKRPDPGSIMLSRPEGFGHVPLSLAAKAWHPSFTRAFLS